MDYLFNFILLGVIYFICFYKRWRKQTNKVFIINTLMYIYIVMVLYVTLMPFSIAFGATNNLFIETANFIPFRDLKMNYRGAFREIVLNIIMMMPFGFLYPLVKKRGIFLTVIVGFLFSLSIETTQLLGTWLGTPWARAFDVTDLITNTVGIFIGYLLFLVFKPLIVKLVNE